MHLYTCAEVMEDVREFEGVTVQLRPDAVTYLNRMHFLRLYSKTYPKPMGDEANVNTLLGRVQEFMGDDEYGVLPFDRSPLELADEHKFIFYRVFATPDNCPYMEFMEASNDFDRVSHFLSHESNEMSIAVVFVEEERVGYYERNKN